jgi:hypothetical protein
MQEQLASTSDPNNPRNYRSFEDFRVNAVGPWTDEGLLAAWNAAHPEAGRPPKVVPEKAGTATDVIDPPAASPLHPDNYAFGSSGVRLRADVPRATYRNHIAQEQAARGNYRLAEIAEAGHGCAYCHIAKSYSTMAEADAAIDLRHYNRVAVGMMAARTVLEFIAVGEMAKSLGGTGPPITGARSGATIAEFEAGLGKLATAEIRVSQRGLEIVETHLAKFGPAAENAAMIARLRAAQAEGRLVSGADASFYMHELNEATRMARLIKEGKTFAEAYEIAHPAAIAKYGVSPFSVYHPEAITAAPPGSFNPRWLEFWEWYGK